MMRNATVGSVVVGFCVLVLGTQMAGATIITFQASVEFSNGTAPVGAPPWLTATFNDSGGSGSVVMTLTATNLTGNEYVSNWDFNIAPSLDVGSLVFSGPTKVGSFTDPTISEGEDQFKADGGGTFDIKVHFATSDGSNTLFGAGDAVSYTITGIPTLTANSFNFLSSPSGSKGLFPMAANVLGIGADNCSGWVSTPEPATVVLLAIAGLMALRRRSH